MSEPKQPPAPEPDEHTKALLADPQFRVLPPAKLTPDEFWQKLRADPQFNVIEPRGKGFILPGRK